MSAALVYVAPAVFAQAWQDACITAVRRGADSAALLSPEFTNRRSTSERDDEREPVHSLAATKRAEKRPSSVVVTQFEPDGSIRGVRIQGGTFSGKQAAINSLSEIERKALLDAIDPRTLCTPTPRTKRTDARAFVVCTPSFAAPTHTYTIEGAASRSEAKKAARKLHAAAGHPRASLWRARNA